MSILSHIPLPSRIEPFQPRVEGGACPLGFSVPRRAAFSLLASLAGCGPRPELALSGIAPPGRFRELEADAQVSWPDLAWWRGFGSPELDALMAQATVGNFDLGVAASRVRQADAQLQIVGAALLPDVSVTGGSRRLRSASLGDSPRSPGRNIYEATLTASYEIDFWGKNRSATEAAAENLRAARFDVGTVALTTEASIANTYFGVLQAQEELRVQRGNLDAAQRILGTVRDQVSAGIATGLDLAQQETIVAQGEAALPALELVVTQGINALAVLVGRVPQEFGVVGGGFGRLRVPAASAGLPAELLARRPDVLAAEAALAAANADVAAARAALLPSIVLSGQSGFQSLVLGALLQPEAVFYSVIASLVQTVFDGGALRGQVRFQQARAEELLVGYRRAIVSALADVENAIAALRRTTEQEARLAGAEAVAARAYGIAEAQLRAGTINLIALLTSQQALFQTRIALVQVRLSRLQAAVGVFRSLGGGWR